VQGQTRQHARLLCLLGVRQLCVGVNKMDCDTAGYKEERYKEIKDEMKHMLTKVCFAASAALGAAKLDDAQSVTFLFHVSGVLCCRVPGQQAPTKQVVGEQQTPINAQSRPSIALHV
jgi:hypothetical protein